MSYIFLISYFKFSRYYNIWLKHAALTDLCQLSQLLPCFFKLPLQVLYPLQTSFYFKVSRGNLDLKWVEKIKDLFISSRQILFIIQLFVILNLVKPFKHPPWDYNTVNLKQIEWGRGNKVVLWEYISFWKENFPHF